MKKIIELIIFGKPAKGVPLHQTTFEHYKPANNKPLCNFNDAFSNIKQTSDNYFKRKI